MKKYFFFYILLLLPIIGIAQTYKYIGVEDGLSNRRVYACLLYTSDAADE